MHIFFDIFGLKIPAYGTMLALGLVLANVFGLALMKKLKMDTDNVFILEGYMLLGAIFGAKALYLITAASSIDWSRMTDLAYLKMVMNGGFVFYGGLIGGILGVLLAGRIHKIDVVAYIRVGIIFVPLAHAIGRVGCTLAGCCYGIPYDGPGALIYPELSGAIPGIPLFPVQLVEAGGLLIIFAINLTLFLKMRFRYTLELYLILYLLMRFGLEYLRYDAIRGAAAGLSTSQWISLVIAAGLIVRFVVMWVRRRQHA
ncbi:MAG: prolipoprotein diacylglyceryl transferase [Lachnospiraceae bacterium]|nr:prolipoprotein diacylglyceryl transferase [Lachnospiraceae bacterium]